MEDRRDRRSLKLIEANHPVHVYFTFKKLHQDIFEATVMCCRLILFHDINRLRKLRTVLEKSLMLADRGAELQSEFWGLIL